MAHSDDIEPNTSSGSLSENANLNLAQDEDKTQGVVDTLNPLPNRTWSQGKMDKYLAHRAQFGEQKSQVQLDRSVEVGSEGSGGRGSDWRDAQSRRMFALDQGMHDIDEALSITMESTDAAFLSTEYLNHAIQQTQLLDPDYALQLMVADRFLVMYPELAVTTRNGFGFAGITEQLGTLIMGDAGVEDFAMLAQTSYLTQSDIGDKVYELYGDTFDPTTKDMIVVSLAGLSEKEQKRHWALIAGYLDARPLKSLEDQIEFANYVAQTSAETYAIENDQSWWGKVGRVGAHAFTNPADWIQDEVIGSLWTAASDPADSWYRKELQLEETIALSMGYDVGTTGWATFTGLAGMGIDIVIDPTNLLLGGFAGFKAARTAALLDDTVRNTTRFQRVARQFVPFKSRKAAIAQGLPTGVRGRSSRMMWAAFAKPHDGLIEVARKKGVFDFIANTNSYSEVVQEIPELRKVDAGLVSALLRRESPEAVEELYSAALRGSLLDPHSTAHLDILAEEMDAQADVAKVVQDLNPNAFTAGDIASANGAGKYHNMPVTLPSNRPIVPAAVARATDGVGEAVVLDETIRTDTLRIAEELLDPAIAQKFDKTEDVITSGGVTVKLRYYEELGEKGVIATIGDDVVGARLGSMAGVAAGQERKGIYSALLEGQKQNQGLTLGEITAGTGGLSESAVTVINRVFPEAAAVPKNVGVAADPLAADQIVSYIVKGDTQIVNLTPGSKHYDEALKWVAANTRYKNGGIAADGSIRRDALQAYLRAHQKDVGVMNGSAVFVDLDGMRSTGKIVDFQGGTAGHSGLAEASNRARVAAYERRMVTPKADTVSKWVISDMPLKVGRRMDDIAFWRSQFGVYGGKAYSEANWLVRKARGFVASVFMDDTPARIATGFENRGDGVRDLRRLLTQMNVDPDLVRRSIDGYLEDPSQAKVFEILRNAADDMGDEEIILGLMRFNDKVAGELEYAVINGGEQLTSGRRVDGSTGLQPLLPSQTRAYVQLPEQRAFSSHIRRVKRATTRTFKSRNRGWGSTRKKRFEMVEEFGRQFKEGSEQGARWAAMNQDEKMAVAYAAVRDPATGQGDGLGVAASMGRTMSEGYSRLRNAFSVSMLAWRPIGWMGNEMLDNAWRGSLADGLSFFTHPFRSVAATYDARNIQVAMDQRLAYQEAIAPIRQLLRSGRNSDEMLTDVEKIIPSIRTHVLDELIGLAKKGDSDAVTAKRTANAIRKFIDTELITSSEAIPVLSDPLTAALFKQRRGYAAAAKYDLPMNVRGQLFDPNWDDVALTGMEKSFTNEIAAASGRHEYAIGVHVNPQLLDDYATALGNVWARDMRDPVIQMYLEQAARAAGGSEDFGYAARRLVNSGSWNKMEEPIRNMARHVDIDVDNVDDLVLAEWYFKNKIAPYVEDIFGDAMTPETVQMMRQGGIITEVAGKVHVVDIDDPESIKELVRLANGTDFVLPKSVVGVVNPRGVYQYGKEAEGWRTPLKSYNQWALNKFGHEIPAKYQRKPAFIVAFNRYKQNFKRLGMTDEGADFAANQKAMEHINKTFFFVEAQTPFLKKMNEVVPFFAAQYEIIKAWTWNIPAAQGGFGIGHARMLRTFDHVFTSMRENGLLQPKYNRDGEVESWNIMFAQDPHTDNLVGRGLSMAGHLGMAAPFILAEQIGEIFSATLLGQDEEERDLDLVPDSFAFKFNHPYEFLGKGGGVLPTARMQLGLNPAMAYPVTKIVDQMPFTSTSNAHVTAQETNLELYLATEDVVDKTAFLTANREVLLSSGAVTEDEFKKLKGNQIGFSTITLPSGISLMHPGTTLAGQFVNNLLFPYGSTDSLQEVISDFTPRVVANMAKTMGLWLNDGEEGATMWLPNLLMGPTGRMGMGTARADAIIQIEMQLGLLTRSGEIAEQMEHHEQGTSEWLELESELHDIDDLIARETKEIAASRAFMSMVFGVVMPFNPKSPTESQTLRSQYHSGRVIAEQWAEGNPMPTPFDGRNAQEAWAMVSAWTQDQTGSKAKQEFLQQHGGRSSILAAIAPRTYWGGTGLPVWAADLTDYYAQVESGDILPLPVDVLRYKIRSTMLQVEREMIFVEEYGNDPMQQALHMLQDGARRKEISELYDAKFQALEHEDELVNDGAWAKHTLEVGDNYVDFAYNDNLEIIEAIQLVQELVELDMYPEDPQEAKAVRGMLIGLSDSAYAAVDVYNDDKYADWDVSPRQEILNEYWTQWGDYTRELAEQYDRIDDANTGEEVSMAYDAIARWVRLEGEKPIRVRGHAFPSPKALNWNNMDEEHQTSYVDAKLSNKLEWLSQDDVRRIVDIYPEATPYLPTSQTAKDIFDWKSEQDALLARKYRIGGEFIDKNDGSSSPRTKHQKVINEEFERMLRAAGEFGVIENINNYPAENFSNFGALPVEVEWIVPYAVSVHRTLLAKDKSALTNEAKVLQRQVYQLTIDRFTQNPALRDPFMLWGMRVFQESTVEGIVAQLLGNYKGDLE